LRRDTLTDAKTDALSKVARVTLAFWIIKILATTLGETGGDALSMTLKLGYAISSLIFLGFFCVTLAAQIVSKRYHPVFYWAVVVATTTVGTTTSDYLDRTLGLGYIKSSIMLLCAVMAVLVAWHYSTGEIAVDHITTRKNEIFYWVTILVSNTLGTAMGDFVATTTGLGFERGALVFAGLIALVAAAHLARTGLRMMPTFPSPPLKFRTAGFPSTASRPEYQTRPAQPPVCLRPSCPLLSPCIPCSESGTMRG